MPRIILLLLLCTGFSAFAKEKNLLRVDTSSFYIRHIEFSGNKITKPKIILREMTLGEGHRIRKNELTDELNFNKRRILNLQLFSSVLYKVNHLTNDSIDIMFEIIEVLYWVPRPMFSLADRNINVWWKEQNHALDRTNLGLELTRMNFRGRSERIGGTVQLGYNKFFDVFYKVPFVDKKLKRGLGISATYATGREINYMTDANKIIFYRNEDYPYKQFQTELTYTFRPAYAIIHEANLSYNYYAITDELYTMNNDYLGGKKKINYFELKYIIGFNNTDIRIYPLNGMEAKLYLSKKGLGIDKDVNQFSARSEISYFKKFSHLLSSAIVFRGRISSENKQPYIFNRALGFKNEYVRGYEYYVIDGSHYALLRGNLRLRILDKIVNQPFVKFIKYIPIRVYAKVFDDIGYVHSKYIGNSSLNNRWLNGYGAGIDIAISYYAKFRLEYSFNHLKQNGLFLHGNKE
ncbi:MAG: hypothetical protein IPI46_04590 [Bacteroidetes bacterium]|nr:hypothetical protein [Bacteroidota bacterium]